MSGLTMQDFDHVKHGDWLHVGFPGGGHAAGTFERGGLNGSHGTVHRRYSNGGGGNRPCPLGDATAKETS